MATVTASEFVRNFGKFQHQVSREQITVTAHGRVTGVYISPEDAELLNRVKESRKAYYAWEAPEEIRNAIRDAEADDEMRQLNRLMDE